jgi:hypothetical protein
MATRSVIADDKTAAGIDRLRTTASSVLRYKLHVLAASAQDVVQSVGGWVFDRARAGWDVNVMVADGGDPRPLTILGATALDLNAALPAMVRSSSRVEALAVSADLLDADRQVRDEVVRVLKRGLTEVTVWGSQWPAELGRQGDAVHHRVSSAARAFKSHALVAADASEGVVKSSETLFRVGSGSFRPLYSV